MMKIASTLPSATEILYRLGVEPCAISHECDHPPQVARLPVITSSPIDGSGNSSDIDRQVKATEAEGSLFSLDTAKLSDIDPDVIVTQDVCDVCAIDTSSVRREIEQAGLDTDIISIDAHTVQDILGNIETLGQATGREDMSSRVIAGLEDRIDAVRDTEHEDTPRTIVFDWMDPVMVAGHWVPELVQDAGGEYSIQDAGRPSRVREWQEIIDYRPETIIVAPCGFRPDQTRANLNELGRRDGWHDLPAVREDSVYIVDGDGYMNRPGPRIIDSLEYLEDLLHRD